LTETEQEHLALLNQFFFNAKKFSTQAQKIDWSKVQTNYEETLTRQPVDLYSALVSLSDLLQSTIEPLWESSMIASYTDNEASLYY